VHEDFFDLDTDRELRSSAANCHALEQLLIAHQPRPPVHTQRLVAPGYQEQQAHMRIRENVQHAVNALVSGPIGDEHFRRATPMELMAQPVLVASIDDVLSTKLMALSEQEPDFRAVLEIARSLREQIDWAYVRRRTETSAFAAAFFTLVESLDIAPREVEPAIAV